MKTWSCSLLAPKKSLILSMALAAFTLEGFAAVINVPVDHVTIQAAVNAASDGDTVLVADGTYLEKVVINKNIILESVNGRASTTIDGSAVPVGTGTLILQGARNGVTIGGLGKGFTIIGSDSPLPAIEWAAIYGTGSLSNISIIDNEVRANGDAGLTFESAVTGSNILIDGNEFSGTTFIPPVLGNGFGDQFDQPNRPRQLVVLGGGPGAGPSSLTGVTFTNNVISGIAGGLNPSMQEQGNTLVTIDCSSSTISENSFEGESTRFGSALRVRRPNTVIEENTFDMSGMGAFTTVMFLQNNTTPIGEILTANLSAGQILVHDASGNVGRTTTIGAAVAAVAAGTTVAVGPGTYNEDVDISTKAGLKLIGAGASTTIISGVLGGANETVLVGTNNVLEGFTITRALGVGENNFGVTITTGTTGSIIQKNIITGNRTAVYCNGGNSQSSIFQNVISANRTGFLFPDASGLGAYEIKQNEITLNKTFGILFNATTSIHADFEISNNNISGNFASQLENNSGSIVNASGNWFGSASPAVNPINVNSGLSGDFAYPGPVSQPGSPYPYGLSGSAAVQIDRSPLLTGSIDIDPSSIGFQGDFSSIKIVTDGAQAGSVPLSRIQEAIDLDSDGGVIAVPAGTYAGDVDASAKAVTLAAGASPGQVVVNGNLTLTSDDTLDVEVETNVPGTGYDQWVINGDISLGGATLALSGGYTIAGGDSLILLDNGGGNPISGAFAGITSPSDLILDFLGSGLNATAEYTGGTGDDFEITFPGVLVVEQPAGNPIANAAIVNYGTTLVGGFIDRTFVVSNNGASDITGFSISSGGVFEIIANTVPADLAPGQSGLVTVRFTPTAAGAESASLTINSSEGAFVVNLQGTGEALPVDTNGNAYSDGNTASIVVGGTRTITVTVPTPTTYQLTLNAGGTWNVSGSPGLSAAGVNLTIDKNLVSQVVIADADVATLTVNMTGSLTQDFEDDFSILLDSGTGVINVTNGQRCAFVGGTSFTATNTGSAASAIQVGSTLATTLSVEGTGTIQLLAESSNVIIQDNAIVSSQAGSISVLSGTTSFLDNSSSVNSATGSVVFEAGTSLTMDPSAFISAGGSGEVNLTARNFLFNAGSSITTANGDILITANEGSEAGDFDGLVSSALIQATGTGDIRLESIGGNTAGDEGIVVTGTSGSNGKILANSGNIVLDGVTQNFATVSGQAIELNGSTVEVSSATGNVSLFGTCNGSSATGAHQGIYIVAGAKVSTGGSGSIDLDGNGGSNGDSNYGVYVIGTALLNTRIESVDGPINITGVGGATGVSGDNEYRGVSIEEGATVVSTGTGPITISGTGGASEFGNGHAGVVIGGGSSTVQGIVTANNGDITITGVGKRGASSASTTHYGVQINRGAVTSTGTADISITATTEGDGNSTDAFIISSHTNSNIISSGTGDVVIAADRMNLGTASNEFILGPNDLTLTTVTAARAVNLGAADSATQLGLTGTELNRVTTTGSGKLIIDSQGGTMTLSAALTLNAGLANLELDASGATLIPAPTVTGTDVTVSNLILTSGTTFGSAAGEVNITSNTANTGYPQLLASGTVDITGVILPEPTTTVPPAAFVTASQTYTLIGGTAITGTFAGKPEGFEDYDFLGAVPPNKTVLSYAGGNVTLTVQGQPEIEVLEGASLLTDDQASPVDYGSNLAVGQPVVKTYTINNTGTADLTISSIVVPSGYIVTNAPAAPILAGGSAVFEVILTGSHVATFSGNVVITHNDPVDPVAPVGSFQFPVTGQVGTEVTVAGVSPEAVVTVGIALNGNVDVFCRANHYELFRSTGLWQLTNVPGVVTGNGTNTLTIQKAGVTAVRINDGPGLSPTTMGVRIVGSGNSYNSQGDVAGRDFDDDLVITLDDFGGTATVLFRGTCRFNDSAKLEVNNTRGTITKEGLLTRVEDGLLSLIGKPPSGGTAINLGGPLVSTGAGNINIEGEAAGQQSGAAVIITGQVQSLDTGTIEILGQKRETNADVDAPGVGNRSNGVRVEGSSALVESATGDITITGNAPVWTNAGADRREDWGVEISAGAKVRGTSGTEELTITVTGTGADLAFLSGASGRNSHGVHIAGTGSEVSLAKGAIIINGQGGSFPLTSTVNTASGVHIVNDGRIISTDTATIEVNGTGGTGGGSSIHGVTIVDSDDTIKAGIFGANGGVTITGIAGGRTGSTSCHGVDLNGAGAEIASSGTGLVEIQGQTTVAGISSGSPFNMSGASKLTSSAAGSDIEVQADRVAIGASAQIELDDQGITFTPVTAGRLINLGGADTATELGLSDAELDRVLTAGRITVGSSTAGKVTVTAAISTAAPGAELELASGGDIEIPAAGSLASLGDVKFNTTAGKVLPIRTGTEVSATGTVKFAAGTALQLPLMGTTPDLELTGYRVLDVTGEVDLTDASLDFAGAFVPTGVNVGDKLVIVQNDDIDPVVGTFTGWPQNSIIPLLNGSDYGAKFNYAGGDGNDVELEIVATSLINGYDGPNDLATALTKPSGSTVNFGFPAFGQVVTRPITLKNTGTAPLNVSAINVMSPSPASPAQYTILNAPSGPIAIGASYTFQVQLNPLVVGVASATIEVVNDDPGTPVLGFNVTATVSTFSLAASMPGFTGPTANIVLDGGKTVTISVPAAPANTYRLQLNTGVWGGEDTPAITGNGTNALVVDKTLVDNVSIIDSDAAGTNAVIFTGSGVDDLTGQSFDDKFVIDLNGQEDGGTAVAGTVSFTGDCEFTGANSLEVSTLRNIIVSAGVDVTVVDGDLTWNANQGAAPTAGSFTGISISGRVVTSGLGDIYMKALGGDGTSERGISLQGTSLNACRVASTGIGTGGSITLLGMGGASSTSTSYGVYLANQYVTVESASGDITMQGSTTSTGSSAYGLVVDDAIVQAIGSDPVDISITGEGSQAANLGGKIGVLVTGVSQIKAEKGSISIVGTGGDVPLANTTADGNYGVLIQAGAQILSTGSDELDAATISITGTAGENGDDDHRGVAILSATTKLSTVAGDMTLTGTGGGRDDPASINNSGVYLTAGVIESTGAGDIKLSGTAGLGVATASNAGIVLTGTGTDIFTDAGTGTLTLEADQINISTNTAHVFITAEDNTVVFQPKTAATPMVIGGADSVSQLGISQAELDRVVTAGKVVFGSSAAGAVSIATAVSRPVETDLEVRSGANIDFVNPGKLTSFGGNVTFLPGTYLLPGTTGVDVDAGTGTVTLGSGSLRAVLNGTALDTGYTQLNVIGALQLTGTALELTGTWTPVNGTVFTLVQNDLTEAVSGIFTGRPENYVFDPVLPPANNKGRLTYLGADGTGNDVVLEIGVPNAKFLFDSDDILNAGTADFGDVSPGYTKTVTVTVENEGTVSLVLFPSVAVGGTNPLQFVLTPTGGWASPVTLAPNASTTFDVAFTPVTVASYSATLTFSSNDPVDSPFVVTVTGEGVIPPAVPVGGLLDDVVTGGEAPGEDGSTSIGDFDSVLYRAGFMSNDGSLVFPGTLVLGSGAPAVTAADNEGIWKIDAAPAPITNLRLLLREGTQAPGALTGELFNQLPTGAPGINRTGESTIMATLSGATTGTDTGLWTEVGDGTLRLVAQEGSEVTSGGPVISQIGRGTPGTSGAGWSAAQVAAGQGEVAFVTSYLNNVGGVTAANATAILRVLMEPEPTAATEIARQGSAAPGVSPAANFGNLNSNDTDPIRMDAAGNFVFLSPLSVSGRSALFYQPSAANGGALQKVFQASASIGSGDDTAPGTGGATFRSLQPASIGTNGYMVFRAILNQNGDNATNAKNDGIWGGDLTNGFTCLLRRGDEVPGPVGSGPATFMVGNTWGGWVTANGDNRSAFRAWVDTNKNGLPSARNDGDVYGIYANTDGDGSTMRLIVREGEAAPGLPGYSFEYFDHPIVGGLNQVAFIGEARSGVTVQRGVWRQSPNGGPLFLLMKLGDSIQTSVNVAPKIVNGISFPGAENNRAVISGTRRIEQPVMDENGRILVWINFGALETSQVLLP